MSWLKRRYGRWKAVREFRAKRFRLSLGMSADAVRGLLGEPDQLNSYEEESELYIEWRYVGAVGKKKDYVLLFDANSNLTSWYKELEDGTAEFEVFAKVKRWGEP